MSGYPVVLRYREEGANSPRQPLTTAEQLPKAASSGRELRAG
jgi:hypothetical protein